MHELEVPRRYRTIYVCGGLGLGSTRAQDQQALRRLHEHLEPGGRLVLDNEVPYADATHWSCWPAGGRAGLPEADQPPGERRLGADGCEYALTSRLLGLDPLRQQQAWEMHAFQWRDGTLLAQERHQLTINLYFSGELVMMLERAGFHRRRGPRRVRRPPADGRPRLPGVRRHARMTQRKFKRSCVRRGGAASGCRRPGEWRRAGAADRHRAAPQEPPGGARPLAGRRFAFTHPAWHAATADLALQSSLSRSWARWSQRQCEPPHELECSAGRRVLCQWQADPLLLLDPPGDHTCARTCPVPPPSPPSCC
jgi:hypothetical protein